MLSAALPAARSSRLASLHSAVTRVEEVEATVPGRRGLQLALGLVWLLDAVLQFQPFMFGPSFVTTIIEPTATGNPSVVASSVTWAANVMLYHIVAYNTVFATVQLVIAAGFFFRRTIKAALAASVFWALFVWWFGESLGGVLAGSTPFAGTPGAVVLYAFIAVLLWPTDRSQAHEPISPATSGPLGATVPRVLWLALWGSFSYLLLLPANRAPSAIGQLFTVTDAQPGWVTSLMNDLSRLAGTAAPRSPSLSPPCAPSLLSPSSSPWSLELR